MTIISCSKNSDFSTALQLTRDYLAWLEMDLSFQNLEHEFSNFSTMYGPPYGLFLLSWHEGALSGGVGLRRLADDVCEMKRLFVYDTFKGMGVGKNLCRELIKQARELNYATMRLDTLDRMQPAIQLYRSLGFMEIGPYRFNPDPSAKYMELSLK